MLFCLVYISFSFISVEYEAVLYGLYVVVQHCVITVYILSDYFVIYKLCILLNKLKLLFTWSCEIKMKWNENENESYILDKITMHCDNGELDNSRWRPVPLGKYIRYTNIESSDI